MRGGQICQEPKRWEEDYELIECEGLFEEYLEMGEQDGRTGFSSFGTQRSKKEFGSQGSAHPLVQ